MKTALYDKYVTYSIICKHEWLAIASLADILSTEASLNHCIYQFFARCYAQLGLAIGGLTLLSSTYESLAATCTPFPFSMLPHSGILWFPRHQLIGRQLFPERFRKYPLITHVFVFNNLSVMSRLTICLLVHQW